MSGLGLQRELVGNSQRAAFGQKRTIRSREKLDPVQSYGDEDFDLVDAGEIPLELCCEPRQVVVSTRM